MLMSLEGLVAGVGGFVDLRIINRHRNLIGTGIRRRREKGEGFGVGAEVEPLLPSSEKVKMRLLWPF